ncbi:hypothetical protein [Mesorhizobium sp. AR07]|uniref:hypothetical protein n=1 Tax=Mesorhizobium sp. AR07 TaxID=2865838 RepID=UPI00215EB0F2|nr:hypothetical protein [Mesorhizobium sp. AR07]
MPGADRFTLLRQRLDAALLGQKSADATSSIGVALAFLSRFQHLSQNSDQFLLDVTVLLLERCELFLGGGLRLSDTAQQHLDQFVTALRADLSQKAQDQKVAPSWPGNGKKFAHLQSPGLGGELPELGVGYVCQRRIRINQIVQPVEALDPQPLSLGALAQASVSTG